MATATTTHITDDIDGGADAEPVTFALQGVAYSIDLSQKNLDKLTKSLAPFIECATKLRGAEVRGGRRSSRPATRSYDIADLRKWASKNKVAVPSRGRIPAAVVEQYHAASAG